MTDRKLYALRNPCLRAEDVVRDRLYFVWRGNWSTILTINK